MKLKVGDNVRVMVGKDKGKEGKITHTFKLENKVIVEGINMVKKHIKPRSGNETGGIVDVEEKINASNVMLIDPKTNKKTRKKITAVKEKKLVEKKETKVRKSNKKEA